MELKMLNSDAGRCRLQLDMKINNHEFNHDVISEIEKELQDNPYDLISLVFLLYDVPDTALQRLIVFQRISKDAGCSSNLNLLHEWFQHANKNPEWKHEFLEALVICQLNKIVRKLGFDVLNVKQEYGLDNTFAQTYINPAKKLLYRLCENMNSNNLHKLQKTLLTYGIDTMGYETAELVLLELMCQKFITVRQFQYDKKVLGYQIQLEKLTKIIESLPGLKKIATDFEELQQMFNDESNPNPQTSVVTKTHVKVDDSEYQHAKDKYHVTDMEDTMDLFKKLHMDDISNENVKCDTINENNKHNAIKLGRDCYDIRDPKRVGVCLIINQEDFYPSRESIENAVHGDVLEKRNGSNRDKAKLEATMKALNYIVFSATNIDHKKMLELIKDVASNKFCENDSIFILCILSHGVRGHVYASDSVKVKIEDIQNLLDDTENLKGKPKLIIVQACQVDEEPQPALVADGPAASRMLNEKKTNFLVYWATAPELEAFRSEKFGSIFIQTLCKTIKELAEKDHILDIYTTVNSIVTRICAQLKSFQVPLFQSTLTKKLYLQIPK